MNEADELKTIFAEVWTWIQASKLHDVICSAHVPHMNLFLCLLASLLPFCVSYPLSVYDIPAHILCLC